MSDDDGTKKDEAVTSHPAIERKRNGLQIKLKRKAKKRKLPAPASRAAGPPVPLRTFRSTTTEEDLTTSASSSSSSAVHQKDDDFIHELEELQELPCDTALALKHVIDTQQCLYIPLHQQDTGNALIPAVMDFQLHQKLEGRLVARELNQLWKQNQKVVRIASLSEDVVLWIANGTYLRALWDAHRRYNNDKADAGNNSITAWFAAQKKLRTKRIIRYDDIAESWQCGQNRSHSPQKRASGSPPKVSTAKLSTHLTGNKQSKLRKQTKSHTIIRSKPVSTVIDTLVKMQILIPTAKQEDTYVLWLPTFGVVLKELDDAQKRIRMQIVRSMYKEVSVASLHQQSTPYNISNKFVVDWMIAQGKLELMIRPAGDFVRLGEES